MALALVAAAAAGRAGDTVRLHALVVTSLITSLLVVSDLFAVPDQAWKKTRDLPPWPEEAEGALPQCPTCGLPVFAHFGKEPPRFLGLSWPGTRGAQPLLFPLVTAGLHANDDRAQGTVGRMAGAASLALFEAELALAKGRGQVTPPQAEPTADPVANAPEGGGECSLPPSGGMGGSYAGSKLKKALDLMAAGILLICLAPLMFAIACVLALLGGRPVLVHQERLDWSGGRFRVTRFRSSTHPNEDACAAAGQPAGGTSARSFRTGLPARLVLEQFLHRSGLAALPVLLSILRGHLSFVGPNPAMPGYRRGSGQTLRSSPNRRAGLAPAQASQGGRRSARLAPRAMA